MVLLSSIFEQLKMSFLGVNNISCQITMSSIRIGQLTSFLFLTWKSWLIQLFLVLLQISFKQKPQRAVNQAAMQV